MLKTYWSLKDATLWLIEKSNQCQKGFHAPYSRNPLLAYSQKTLRILASNILFHPQGLSTNSSDKYFLFRRIASFDNLFGDDLVLVFVTWFFGGCREKRGRKNFSGIWQTSNQSWTTNISSFWDKLLWRRDGVVNKHLVSRTLCLYKSFQEIKQNRSFQFRSSRTGAHLW